MAATPVALRQQRASQTAGTAIRQRPGIRLVSCSSPIRVVEPLSAAPRGTLVKPQPLPFASSDDQPFSRRSILGTLGALYVLAGVAVPPLPAAAAISEDELQLVVEGASSIIPAMSSSAYVTKIQDARQRAFNDIRNLIDEGKFKVISDNLSIDPFDSIYQSAFYLPWALLKQRAVDPAQQCYDAFMEFTADVKAFDKLCLAASHNQVDDDDVLTGLGRIEASLDKLLSTVPSA